MLWGLLAGKDSGSEIGKYVGAHCEMLVSIMTVVGWKAYESGRETARLGPLALGTDACFRLSQTQLTA